MEKKATQYRDQWLSQFKREWDGCMSKLKHRRDKRLHEADTQRDINKAKHKKQLEKRIAELHQAYADAVAKEDNTHKYQCQIINEEYDSSVLQFVARNTKKDNMVDSVCRYTLSLMKMVLGPKQKQSLSIGHEPRVLINNSQDNYCVVDTDNKYPMVLYT